jgi:hypothetical protein
MVKIQQPKEYTLENIQEVIESHTKSAEIGYIEPGCGLKKTRVDIHQRRRSKYDRN